MNPRFVERAAFILAGVTAAGHPAQLDVGAIWEKAFMPFDSALKELSMDGGYYGATISENGSYLYLAGMAMKSGTILPPGIETRIIPCARFAVFNCALNAIGSTWKEAYETWLPGSTCVLDTSAIDFEFYPPVPANGVQEVEIHLPVKDKVHAA